MDTNSQLWQLVREYVTSSEDRGTDSGELVGFLLELGFHLVGEAYSVNSLSPALQKVLDELAALGLVKLQQGMKESWYIPTKLASNLSASLSESTDWQSSEGFVVVETNFKVYAYTSSKLQTEILRCFTRFLLFLAHLYISGRSHYLLNRNITWVFRTPVCRLTSFQYLEGLFVWVIFLLQTDHDRDTRE